MRTVLLLFTLHLFTRFIFILIVGLFNNYSQADSLWLVELSDKVLQGDFNFELQRFVVSPLFPTLVGIFKILFGQYWDIILIVFQLVLSALSGVFIYKIALLLFNNCTTGLLASFIFAVFPLTLWFTHSFSQECIFQALFIFTLYYLIKSIRDKKIIYVIISAFLFSLTYLTKSHVLLFSVFIPIIYFHYFKFRKETFIYSITFASISLLCSLPYGLYQYNIHNSYVISSNGAGYQFYLGNTEAGYKTVVDVPSKDSKDYIEIKNINVTAGYFNGSISHYDSIMNLPQKEKQALFFKEGIEWIQNNPTKFIELKLYDALFFLIPGVNWKHYRFSNWFFSFLISLPIYIFAYIAIIKLIKERNTDVVFVVYLFLAMLGFSLIWYVQNRFRTITLEPFYIIYAAFILTTLIEKTPILNKIMIQITLFFTSKEKNIKS